VRQSHGAQGQVRAAGDVALLLAALQCHSAGESSHRTSERRIRELAARRVSAKEIRHGWQPPERSFIISLTLCSELLVLRLARGQDRRSPRFGHDLRPPFGDRGSLGSSGKGRSAQEWESLQSPKCPCSCVAFRPRRGHGKAGAGKGRPVPWRVLQQASTGGPHGEERG